ncbi:MAG: hypothetical protein ABIY63_14245 [Fibrobacteria bacterium]
MCRQLIWLFTVVIAFTGCDSRRAGTETGNPEITVAAYIAAFDDLDNKTLALNFQIMGMGYSIARPVGAPDSGKCWTRPGGILVNFADPDFRALPDTLIEDKGDWTHAEITLRTPDGPAEIPDTADIGTWSSPRYAKFTLTRQKQKRLILFEMPQGVEYRLLNEFESTQNWRSGEKIWVPLNIDAAYWTEALTSFQGMKMRNDRLGAPYMLLSPTENSKAWNALKVHLPDCFHADSVTVR